MTQLPKPPSLPTASKPTPPPPPPPPRPPSNPFGNRLGGRAEYPILSSGELIARFELTSIPAAIWNPSLTEEHLPAEDAIALFESNKLLAEQARANLDQAWGNYGFRGAALLYIWRDELRHAVNNRLVSLKRPTIYLHVTDPALILNILGRSRAALLLTDAPLALERIFLSRVLATDDPRLIALAREWGSREELLFEPPPPDESDDDDDKS
jgi:hypothetical protein